MALWRYINFVLLLLLLLCNAAAVMCVLRGCRVTC